MADVTGVEAGVVPEERGREQIAERKRGTPGQRNAAPSRQASGGPRRWRQPWALWLLLPGFLFLAGFFFYPLVKTIYGSVGGTAFNTQFYVESLTNKLYTGSVIRTFVIGFNVTALCLGLGYPVAYYMTTLSKRAVALLSICILVPLFTAFLIRTYAWMVILGRNGVLNKFLVATGLIDAPLKVLGTSAAVYVGMVHVLLPIAIFTLYASLVQVDRSLMKAAEVLGATPVRAFIRVYFPMSVPATISAAVLVFIMAIGFYITPVLLGGPSDTMISQLIVTQITALLNMEFGYALSVILLAVTLLILFVTGKIIPLEQLWALQGESGGARKRRFALGAALRGPVLRLLSALEHGWHRLLGRPHWLIPAVVRCHVALIVLFLTAPLVIVYVLSFSSSPFLVFPPPGFSLRWYERFFTDPDWRAAILMSLRLAVCVACLSTILGTAAAFGLVRGNFAGKRALFLFILSPLLVPIIVLSIGLYGVMSDVSLLGTFPGLLMGHLVLAMPYAVIVLIAAIRGLDRNLEYAAGTLGARPATTFRKVVMPILFPALGAAWVMSFLVSFDELLISIFLLGRQTPTLPIKMWNDIRMQIDPTISAASSVIITVVIITITVLQYRALRPHPTYDTLKQKGASDDHVA